MLIHPANYPLSIIHLNRRPTPSAVVNPDGGWLNTATSDWMVNGENSAILLFLKYNLRLTSTLSVFSYQFGLLLRKIRFPLLPIDHSPPQPAGCVTATPLLLLLFNPDCFGIKFRRRRNRTKRGGLCSYWFKFEYRLEIILMPLLVFWPTTEAYHILTRCQ